MKAMATVMYSWYVLGSRIGGVHTEGNHGLCGLAGVVLDATSAAASISTARRSAKFSGNPFLEAHGTW